MLVSIILAKLKTTVMEIMVNWDILCYKSIDYLTQTTENRLL